MAYNLRTRRVRDLLLQTNEPDNSNDGASNEEVQDHVSKQSEYSDEETSSEKESSEDELMEVEDATTDARLLKSRARGRLTSKLRGKNGYIWSSKLPERRSGTLFIYIRR